MAHGPQQTCRRIFMVAPCPALLRTDIGTAMGENRYSITGSVRFSKKFALPPLPGTMPELPRRPGVVLPPEPGAPRPGKLLGADIGGDVGALQVMPVGPAPPLRHHLPIDIASGHPDDPHGPAVLVPVHDLRL